MVNTKRSKSKRKVSKKKIKKPVKKQPVKHPNKLPTKLLKDKCARFNKNLLRSVQHILEQDNLSVQDAPLTAYILNMVFKYDCLFDGTTSPYFLQLNEDLISHMQDEDVREYYQSIVKEMILRQNFLSITRDYISGTAGGKYQSKLKKINETWRK